MANYCVTRQMFSDNTIEKYKSKQSPAIVDLCLRKSRSDNSHGRRFQTLPAFPNSSGLESVSKKLPFGDGLQVWTVGLTVAGNG